MDRISNVWIFIPFNVNNVMWYFKFIFCKRKLIFFTENYLTDDSFENVDTSKSKFEQVVSELLILKY